MPKRVSLKGRGADIFFGEYAPSPTSSDADGPEARVAALPVSAPPRSAATAPVRRARTGKAATPPAEQQSTDQSISQPTDQSTNRPIGRPNKRLIDRVVDRPKAFYITEGLDRQLDDAVRYFQMQHGLRKVDRSILLTTMLSDERLWTDSSLDQLVDRLMSQLTSRLRR